MANSNSGADLLKGALQKAGEPTNGNSTYHGLALKYINNVYLDLLSGGSSFLESVGDPWPWARSRTPKTLVLKAPYETGSVTVTTGSATGTFSIAPDVSLGSFKDRHLQIDGQPDIYKITAHTAGSASFTIDTGYVSTGGAGLTFRAHKLIYNISNDVLRLCAPIRLYRSFGWDNEDDGQILDCNINNLQKEYPLSRLERRIPKRFAELYRDDTEWLIQFSSSVNDDTKVDFDWIPRPTDLIDSATSIPRFPLERRHLIEAGAAHLICIDKGDDKAGYFFNLVKGGLSAMMSASIKEIQQSSGEVGKLTPRMDLKTNNKYRGVY